MGLLSSIPKSDSTGVAVQLCKSVFFMQMRRLANSFTTRRKLAWLQYLIRASFNGHKVGIINHISQMRRMEVREVNSFAVSHITRKLLRCNLNPAYLVPKFVTAPPTPITLGKCLLGGFKSRMHFLEKLYY